MASNDKIAIRSIFANSPKNYSLEIADLLIGIGVRILPEFITQVVLGLPFNYLSNPDQKLVSKENHHTLTINSAAVFTNYISIKKQLDAIPQ
ncbi:hypothetical protein GCM10028808_15870 [Spirosoma migulaei]